MENLSINGATANRRMRVLLCICCVSLLAIKFTASNGTAAADTSNSANPDVADDRPVVADDPETYAIKSVVRKFFDRYAAEDVAGSMAFWSRKSPLFLTHERVLKRIVSVVDDVRLVSLEIKSVTMLDASTARVHCLVHLSGRDKETGRDHWVFEPNEPQERVLTLIKQGDRWKIHQYGDLAQAEALRETHVAANIVQQAWEALVTRGVDAYMAFWSTASPSERQRRQQQLAAVIGKAGRLELKSLQIELAKIISGGETEYARIRFLANVTGIDAKTGKVIAAPHYLNGRRTIQLTRKKGGRWRILLDLGWEIELANIFNYTNHKATRDRIFFEELPVDKLARQFQLTVLTFAYVQTTDRKRAQQLLREEPLLREDVAFRVAFGDYGGGGVKDYLHLPGTSQWLDRLEDMVKNANRSLAHGYVHLYRGIHLEHQQQFAEALTYVTRARRLFKQFTQYENSTLLQAAEMTALIHQGRLYAKLKRFAEAREAFETAEKNYKQIKHAKLAFDDQLDADYLKLLRQKDDLEQQAYQKLVAGKPDEVIGLLTRMLAIEEKLFERTNDDMAETLNWRAMLHAEAGDFDAARKDAKLSREILLKLVGADHWLTHRSAWTIQYVEQLKSLTPAEHQELRRSRQLAFQGFAKRGDGERAESLRLMSEAVELRKPIVGEGDYLTAFWGCAVANRRYRLKQHEQAHQLFDKFMPTAFRIRGNDPKAMDLFLRHWLRLLTSQRDEAFDGWELQAARLWAKRLVEVATRYYGDDAQRTRAARSQLAMLERAAALSVPQVERLREADKMLKKGDRLVNEKVALYTEALEQYESALAIYRELLGEENSLFAKALGKVGDAAYYSRDYERCTATYHRLIEIKERFLSGPAPFDCFRLGVVLFVRGQFTESRAQQQKALELEEMRNGAQSDYFLTLTINLAVHNGRMGNKAESRRLFKQALLIQKRKILPPDHEHYASGSIRLVFPDELFETKRKEIERYADMLLDYASRSNDDDWNNGLGVVKAIRRLCERLDGQTATKRNVRATGELASIYEDRSKYRSALPWRKKAVEYAGKLYAPNHVTTLQLRRELARCHLRLKQVDEAEPILVDCVRILRERNDRERALFWNTLRLLSECEFHAGRFDDALAHITEAIELEHAYLQRAFRHASIAGMRAEAVGAQNRLYYLLKLTAAVDESHRQKYVDAAFTWTLRRRALIAETYTTIRREQSLAARDPKIAALAKRLHTLRNRQSELVLNPPREGLSTEVEAERKRLREEADNVEAQLNGALVALHPANAARSAPLVDLADVAAQLGTTEALIEIKRIIPFRRLNQTGRLFSHYYAFAVSGSDTGKAKVQMIKLGRAGTINADVSQFREAVNDALRAYRRTNADDLPLDEADWVDNLSGVSRTLFDDVIRPVQAAVAGARTWYIVPEGELSRLPFEALIDEDGKYFLQSTRVAYLTSGRDLLRPKTKPAVGTAIFAAADFNLESHTESDERDENLAEVAAESNEVALRGGFSNDLRGSSWDHLKATLIEAAEIKETIDDSRYGPVKTYLGPSAHEGELKKLPPPRILHLATHGFFLPDADKRRESSTLPVSEGKAFGQVRGFARLRKSDNPLMRSGVVLTGANTLGLNTTGEDGWLTAQEIALLNLHGTELVVLSACESGLGKLETGEGVQGLRVAFRYAGARTLISTLFKVPDKPTQRLMREFYRRLKAGESKLDALRNAQLAIVAERQKDHDVAHPLFWASFVLVGDAE